MAQLRPIRHIGENLWLCIYSTAQDVTIAASANEGTATLNLPKPFVEIENDIAVCIFGDMFTATDGLISAGYDSVTVNTINIRLGRTLAPATPLTRSVSCTIIGVVAL